MRRVESVNHEEMWNQFGSWMTDRSNRVPFTVKRKFRLIEEQAKAADKKRVDELAAMEAELGLPEGFEPTEC